MNPLFNALGGNQAPANPVAQMMQEVQRIQQNISDPRAEVQRLLNSGAMSQAQFNQFAQIANQIVGAQK